MARTLTPADPAEVAAALDAHRSGSGDSSSTRLLVKHILALLTQRAPGRSVEVRVPPYAAIQCIDGVRHTRGTPPAVIEVNPQTLIDLATGALTWTAAVEQGWVFASGERADLTPYLPLLTQTP